MPITIRSIISATAAEFRIASGDITGHSRRHVVSQPRAIAVYLCRRMTKASQTQIGRELAYRDHTTVLHLERRGKELSERPDMRERVKRIKQALTSQP
jgi:chromosomal replication initiator protein